MRARVPGGTGVFGAAPGGCLAGRRAGGWRFGRVSGGVGGVGHGATPYRSLRSCSRSAPAPGSPLPPVAPALRFRPLAPEVPLVRQLSVPARWAAVTALTIAASTGCMSVGEDDARAPGPSRSAGPKGSAADPAGDTVPGSGRTGRRVGGVHPQSDRAVPGSSPSPDASGAVPSVTPGDPRPEPAAPGPTRGGPPPSPTPSTPGPGEPPPTTPEPPAPPTPAPDPEPDPEPTAPSEPPPSASPAAQLRAHAMSGPEAAGPRRTPEASPQVGPV